MHSIYQNGAGALDKKLERQLEKAETVDIGIILPELSIQAL
ncbi:hypothetical protein SAMN04488057_11853 [Cyclobacterium lianum]|uniref:Uncharacterized protein n=1 Tax=Cyclobacterium lianum TaxID=388280 RepID=A0A1M7QHL6_9BACT|nr:hypothetical protein SAMN04488057_11853 [Cyclobacterium lianum]